MTKVSLLLGLAILADAGIAMLISGTWALPARGGIYAVLGVAASLGLVSWPPFFSALALASAGLAMSAAIGVLTGAGADPEAAVTSAAGAALGVFAGYLGPRVLAGFRSGLRGRRAGERRPGRGLTVRISGRSYPVRDWSVFGVFIEAPQNRFAEGREFQIEIDTDKDKPSLSAEVVRVAGSGVGLRFVGLAQADRAALHRRLIELTLAA